LLTQSKLSSWQWTDEHLFTGVFRILGINLDEAFDILSIMSPARYQDA
jgi:hypothetical protein